MDILLGDMKRYLITRQEIIICLMPLQSMVGKHPFPPSLRWSQDEFSREENLSRILNSLKRRKKCFCSHGIQFPLEITVLENYPSCSGHIVGGYEKVPDYETGSNDLFNASSEYGG